MEGIWVFLGITVGLGIGAFLMWLVSGKRADEAFDRAKAEAGTSIAVLNEQIRTRSEQAGEMKRTIDIQKEEINSMSTALNAERERNSALAERAERIPELERMIESEKKKKEETSDENTELRTRISKLATRMEEERKAAEEKLKIIENAQEELSNAFKAMSSEALKSNNVSFLELASETLGKFQEAAKGDLDKRSNAIDQLVKPLKESLDKMDRRVVDIEKARESAYAGLTQQIRSLNETQSQLQKETTNLVKALRAPSVRGIWGEMQLKRVVEMAGMIEYCDFHKQQSVNTENGRLRPDMIVNLPGGKKVVVDAKAPLDAYLKSLEAEDEDERKEHLKHHAKQVGDHLIKLGNKAYWDQFSPTPEFVVLFLPGETFFSAALEQDASLIEKGVNAKVILATPTTLIALLRAVAYGWQQERLLQNAEVISSLGSELYGRIRTMANHFHSLKNSLEKTVESYNRAVGSFEGRVLQSARRFKDLGISAGEEIKELEKIDVQARSVSKQAALTSDEKDDAIDVENRDSCGDNID